MTEIEQSGHPTLQERYLLHNFKFDIARECRRYGPLPPIQGIEKVPECLVSITDVKKVNWAGAFIHSFKDDYKFDTRTGIWYDTGRILKLVTKKRMGLLTPDFSTYSDSHPEICRWNLFRSRLIGYEAEATGVPVIATITWWDDESVEFALNGLSPGRVYAVSTIGVALSREDKEEFGKRIRYVCSVLKPQTLLVYGSTNGIDWGGQRIRAYSNGTYGWVGRKEEPLSGVG